MSPRRRILNPESLYFITITIVDWIALLNRPVYKHIIVDALNYCIRNKGLAVYAYVIMDNHIHLIVNHPEGKLDDVIRDFKKFTSKKLFKMVSENPQKSRKNWLEDRFTFLGSVTRNKRFKIWQDGYFPTELVDNQVIGQKLNYIHENPVEAEIVSRAEDYKYSSASFYAGGFREVIIECCL